MVELRPVPVDDPVSRELLAEYFAMRAETFPGQRYTTVFPSPDVFTEPAGVFIVLTDDDGRAGGMRRHPPHRGRGARHPVRSEAPLPATRDARSRLGPTAPGRSPRGVPREWDAAELVLDTHHTLEAAGGLYASVGFREIAPYNDNPNATRWYGLRLVAVDESGQTE